MPETPADPPRIAVEPPAAPSPSPGTPETDIGALLAELRRLRHQYGKVAGELADATMTMWHLEPGDRSDMPLAKRITTRVAELRAQRDAARADLERVAAERDQALAEQETMQARLAEVARQRDAAAAERDRIRGEMERCVWIDPRRQSGTPCLGGTRISAHIIARLIADGTTAEQIRDMYPDVTDGHLRAVAAFMAERDTARRDGAADALAYAARRAQRRHSPVGAPCVTSTELRNWAAQARSGELAIPEEVTGHG